MEIPPINTLLDLSGKTAIVTGAVGIGYGIAYRLAQAGCNVVIASKQEVEAIDAAAKITAQGLKATGIATDVSSEQSVIDMIDTTIRLCGNIDILVNNAGIYPSIPVSQMSSDDFDKVISVNLKGVFLCSKYASLKMIERGKGGRIINITSVDALHPSSIGLAHYDASKHGVWGFTKNIALELAPHKIWVNAVAPGGILTEGVKKLQLQHPATAGIDQEKIMSQFLQKIPMGRLGEPDDIGKVVLFLASDMASYMTGSQIVVDGGVLLS